MLLFNNEQIIKPNFKLIDKFGGEKFKVFLALRERWGFLNDKPLVENCSLNFISSKRIKRQCTFEFMAKR